MMQRQRKGTCDKNVVGLVVLPTQQDNIHMLQQQALGAAVRNLRKVRHHQPLQHPAGAGPAQAEDSPAVILLRHGGHVSQLRLELPGQVFLLRVIGHHEPLVLCSAKDVVLIALRQLTRRDGAADTRREPVGDLLRGCVARGNRGDGAVRALCQRPGAETVEAGCGSAERGAGGQAWCEAVIRHADALLRDR